MNNNKALIVRPPNQVARNGEYKSIFEDLSRKKRELEDLNREIIQTLDIPVSKIQKALMRVSRVLPFLKKNIDKYTDPLGILELKLKQFINLVQESLISLQKIAQGKNDEVSELKNDLERAVAENWDIKKLREYLLSKTGLEIYQPVIDLMDFELEILSDEAKETKKISLLKTLAANGVAGDQLMKLIAQVVFNSLTVFESAVNQYYAFTSIAEPMRIIKESAENLAQTTEAMYIAKDATKAILEKSVAAIQVATEAARMADQYRVTNNDMLMAIKRAKEQLEYSNQLMVPREQLWDGKQLYSD